MFVCLYYASKHIVLPNICRNIHADIAICTMYIVYNLSKTTILEYLQLHLQYKHKYLGIQLAL